MRSPSNEPKVKLKGSYKAFVTARANRDPSLRSLSDFLTEESTTRDDCSGICLDIPIGNHPPTRRLIDSRKVAALLDNKWGNDSKICGRILIVEDLCQSMVEALGSRLNIDPLFFASHMDTNEINMAASRSSVATLPSTTRSHNFLNLHYHRVINIEERKTKETLFRDMNIRRKVQIIPQNNGLSIGLVRHCCSVLDTVGPDEKRLGNNEHPSI